jgi:BRCT domain type II-containing protein
MTSICFTGELSRMTRTQAHELSEKYGYQCSARVVHGLNFLVSNSDRETTKTRMAKVYNIKIITEDHWISMLLVRHRIQKEGIGKKFDLFTKEQLLIKAESILEDIIVHANKARSISDLVDFIKEYKTNIDKEVLNTLWNR